MRPNATIPLFLLALVLAACGGAEPAATASEPVDDGDLAKRIARLEKRLVELDRQSQKETIQLIRQQQEIARNHLEEVSEDLNFQMGKLLQHVTRLEASVYEILDRFQQPGAVGALEAAEVKQYTPEMRKEIAEKLADRGIRLEDDRVSVDGFIGPGRAAPLEFFAVLRGGKEHEAVVIVTGSYGPEERLPRGLAAGLNLACQALNLPRGAPTRWKEGGKPVPASGEPVHVYVEWEKDGKTVRARAEDLVYNETEAAAMGKDSWIYVGSRFVRNIGTGQREFMAEITGSLAATFGSENSILSNRSPEATDDNQANFFRGYTPRIPPEGTKVKLVIARAPLEANAVFDE
jgi:hypothetical protein